MIEYKNKSIEKIVEIFKNHQIRIPRILRVQILKKVFKELQRDELAKLEKEIAKSKNVPVNSYSRFHRLKNYQSLSEFQLENDFSYYKDPSLETEYLNLLWEKLETHLISLENGKEVIKEINALEKSKDEENLSILEYNRRLDPYFYCEKGYIDGVLVDKAPAHFAATSGKNELYELGMKYGIVIPKHRNKQDLQSIALKEYGNINKLSKERKNQIMNANTNDLKEMLNRIGKDVKMHVTKEEIVKKIIAEITARKLNEESSSIPKEQPSELVKESNNEIVMSAEKGSYDKYYEQIIKNQETIIELLNKDGNDTQNSKYKIERVYNIIVITLIVIVSIIWIIYGFSTLF